MSCLRWSLPLFLLGLGTAEVRAQIGFNRGFGYGYGFGALGYRHVGHHSALALSIGGIRSYGYGYGYGFYPGFAPFGYSSVVNIVNYSPPPPMLFPAPNMLLQGVPLDILARNNPLLNPPPLDEDVLPPPLGPAARPAPPAPAPAKQPEKVLPPKAPPEAPPEKPKPKPPAKPKEPQLKLPPGPKEDPLEENARLIELGKQAFAALEPGRAAHRFRQAVRVAPNQPFAHFLLAQTLLALGKYPEALDALHAGLALNPAWPRTPFRPLDLYGRNVAEYPQHLQQFEGTLNRHPNDPTLLFLYAYELWLDGRRNEAAVYFQRALAHGADQADVQLFLRALPPAPVL